MRLNQLILIILTFLVTFNSNAAELNLEPHAMLYYQIPLGGGHKDQKKHTFGFRIDNAIIESGKHINYQRLFDQKAVLDFKMHHEGIESFTISGVDYLKQYRLLHANGEGEEVEESVGTEEDAYEDEAEGPGFFESLPGLSDIVDEDQYLGLLVGALIGVGILIGAGD